MTDISPPSWFHDILTQLTARRDLNRQQMTQVMQALMTGQCSDIEATAFLVGLRTKGESAEEIAAAAEVLRQHMIAWDPGDAGVLDTCGTGGDGLKTFNISTATAIVVAAALVPVVKHGNRSVSSNSGSADVLAELGVTVEGDAESARRSLQNVGLAFCFAPNFHPAMKHVGPLRKRLGIPTLFNCLGPLANPANALYQLLGVGHRDLLDKMAGALARLGIHRVLVVHGVDGLDEVTLSGPTHVRLVSNGTIESFTWTPADFALATCPASDLVVTGPKHSADVIRGVLAGQPGPALDIVLANGAAALFVAEKVDNVKDGVEELRDVITKGRAQQVLQEWISTGQE